MSTRSQSLIQGPIWKGMLLFAMPVFLSNLFQQLYNTFDAWCVGNYINDNALAAVSSSGSLIFMFVSFFNGLAMGAGVVIARTYGAKEYDVMGKTIHTAIAFGLAAGAALTVLGVAFTPTVLRWMDTPAEVLPQSIEYFRFYFLGAIFTVMYNMFVGIFHAVGDSRHPFYYLIISTGINIGLDMLFVAGLGWGVGSAAFATTLSQGISALLCFVHILRVDAPYRVTLRHVRFHKDRLLEIIRYGVPSGIQNSVISIANVVVQANINDFGKDAMAGCGSYSKLEGFAFLPVTCFSQALATFVGQNLGAGKHKRVMKGVAFGALCSCAMAEAIGLLSHLFAPSLIRFFGASADAVDFGTAHMRTVCLFYCLMAFSHCIAGVLRGAGKATVPMVIMLCCWCVFRVSYITVAVNIVHELTTVSWAYPLSWTLSALIFLIYFLKADWIHTFDKQKEAQKA